MPREDLDENERVIYDVLDGLTCAGNPWETANAFEAWVNDNFMVEDFGLWNCIRGTPPEEFDLVDVRLGWK